MAEIFGIVAGAVGISSVLVHAFGNLAEQNVKFRSYHAHIDRFHNSLHVLQQRLDAWEQKWQLRALTVNEFQPRWGDRGSIDVKKQLQLLEQDARAIRNRLNTSRDLPVADKTVWDQIVLAARSQMQDRRSGLFERVGDRVWFAVYRSDDLNRRLASLDRLIQSLEQVSEHHWRTEQGVPSGKPIDSGSIKEVLRLCDNAKKWSGALSETHGVLCDDTNCWALLLPITQDEPFCPLNESRLVTFELLQAAEFSQTHIVQKLTVSYFYEQDQQYLADLASSMSAPSDAGVGVLKHNMRSFFYMVTGQPSKRRNKLCRGRLLERAHTALCIAAWALAAWSSGWMMGLCNCAIRTAHLRNFKVPSWTHRRGSSQSPCFVKDDSEPHNYCYAAEFTYRQHLRLAVTLAELALACVIEIVVENGQVKFNLRPTAGPDEVVIEEMLLAKIVAATNSRLFKDAVSRCFDFDRDECKQQQVSFDSPAPALRGIDVQRYEIEVIKKLQQNFNRVKSLEASRQASTAVFRRQALLANY